MITLFESFKNKINLKDYIKQEDGVFKIPNVKFEKFGEYFVNNPLFYTQIKYNSLMRFFLYMKLLRYNGDSPIIKLYIEGLKSKDSKKVEIINKIPNNRHVFSMINENFKLDYPNYNYDNLQDLKKFIYQWEEILNDKYLVEYIEMVRQVSMKASMSEKIVKGVLTMLYSKFAEIVYAKIAEDLKGMDLWKIDKKTGSRQSIQVKNITGNVRFNIKEDIIYIDGTDLDLHNYYYKTDKLPYDYLCFYLEKDKKICIIKSTAIFSIKKITEKKTIIIKLRSWAMEPDWNKRVFKLVDVPKKFIGKDVSNIFYNPQMEIELQDQFPDE